MAAVVSHRGRAGGPVATADPSGAGKHAKRASSASAAHRNGGSPAVPPPAWGGFIMSGTAPTAAAAVLSARGQDSGSPYMRYTTAVAAAEASGGGGLAGSRRARPTSAAPMRAGGGGGGGGGANGGAAAGAFVTAYGAPVGAATPATMAAAAAVGAAAAGAAPGGPRVPVRAYALSGGGAAAAVAAPRGGAGPPGYGPQPLRTSALFGGGHGAARGGGGDAAAASLTRSPATGSVGGASAGSVSAPSAGAPAAGARLPGGGDAKGAGANGGAAVAVASLHGALPLFLARAGAVGGAGALPAGALPAAGPGGAAAHGSGGGAIARPASAGPARSSSLGPTLRVGGGGGGGGGGVGSTDGAKRPGPAGMMMMMMTPAGPVASGAGGAPAHAPTVATAHWRPQSAHATVNGGAAAAAAAAARAAPSSTSAAAAAAAAAAHTMHAARASSAPPGARVPAYGATGAPAAALRRASTASDGSMEERTELRETDARAQVEALRRVVASARFSGRGTPDMYAVGKVLGEGSFGKVRLAMHKLTGVRVAIKTYEKAKLQDPAHWRRAMQEIRLMERLNHPYVIRMLECIDSPKRVHIVMEYAGGGNLCQHVKAHKRLLENEARRIFIQILLAAEYMHNCGIIHRDIKLENVLFDDARNMKLVDFGFSVGCRDPTKRLKIFCGTPSYMAPEIVMRQEYLGRPVDVWSLGVLLFAMLVGSFPFVAKSYPELYKKIVRANLKIPEQLSKAARDLIRRMMHPDPAKRFTFSQARRHPWAAGIAHAEMRAVQTMPEKCLTISEDVARDLYEAVLVKMEELGFKREHVVRSVLARARNHYTTSYYLLLFKTGRPRAEADAGGAASALIAAGTGGAVSGAAAAAMVNRHHPSRAAVAGVLAPRPAAISGCDGEVDVDAEDAGVSADGLLGGDARVDDGLGGGDEGGGGSEDDAGARGGGGWAGRGRGDGGAAARGWGPSAAASARSDESSDGGGAGGDDGAHGARRAAVPMRPASAPIGHRVRAAAPAGALVTAAAAPDGPARLRPAQVGYYGAAPDAAVAARPAGPPMMLRMRPPSAGQQRRADQ